MNVSADSLSVISFIGTKVLCGYLNTCRVNVTHTQTMVRCYEIDDVNTGKLAILRASCYVIWSSLCGISASHLSVVLLLKRHLAGVCKTKAKRNKRRQQWTSTQKKTIRCLSEENENNDMRKKKEWKDKKHTFFGWTRYKTLFKLISSGVKIRINNTNTQISTNFFGQHSRELKH